MFGKKELKETVLHIEGMHCNMCSTRMQKAFLGAKGVQKAEVSLEEKCARIVYDAGKLTEDDLKSIVKETGYEPA